MQRPMKSQQKNKRKARISSKVAASPSVTEYLNALEHTEKSTVLAVRDLILSIDPRITEEVKWNAPSFRIREHFATFRLHPAPICQLVLHTGSKPRKDGALIEIADPAGLLKWASADRCIVTFASAADAKAKFTPLKRILESWVKQTGVA